MIEKTLQLFMYYFKMKMKQNRKTRVLFMIPILNT